MMFLKKIIFIGVVMSAFSFLYAGGAVKVSDYFHVQNTGGGSYTDPFSGETYKNQAVFSIGIKGKRPSYQPWFEAEPPSFNYSCSGFSFKTGFMKFLGLDMIGDQLADAGASLVWGIVLGLSLTLPVIGQVFKFIRSITDRLRKLLSDACSIGQKLGQSFAQRSGWDKVQGGLKSLDNTVKSTLNGQDGWYKGFDDWLTSKTTIDGTTDNVAQEFTFSLHGPLLKSISSNVLSSMFGEYRWCDGGKEVDGIFSTTLFHVFESLSANGDLELEQLATTDSMAQGATQVGKPVSGPCSSASPIDPASVNQRIMFYKLFNIAVGEVLYRDDVPKELSQLAPFNMLPNLTTPPPTPPTPPFLPNQAASDLATTIGDKINEPKPPMSAQTTSVLAMHPGRVNAKDFFNFIYDANMSSLDQELSNCESDSSGITCKIENYDVLMYAVKKERDKTDSQVIRGISPGQASAPLIPTNDSVMTFEWDGFKNKAQDLVDTLLCMEFGGTNGPPSNPKSAQRINDLGVTCPPSNPNIYITYLYPDIIRYTRIFANAMKISLLSPQEAHAKLNVLKRRLALSMTHAFAQTFDSHAGMMMRSSSAVASIDTKALLAKQKQMRQFSRDLLKYISERTQKFNDDHKTFVAEVEALELRLQKALVGRSIRGDRK